MSWWPWLLVGGGLCGAVYLALLLGIVAAGRRSDLRAVAGFVPDVAVLVRRLMGDPRIPRSRKLLLGGLLVYLVSPIDLVPDFIPAAGLLDDVVVAAWALRAVLRSGGPELLSEHWPGPRASLEVASRIAFGASAERDARE